MFIHYINLFYFSHIFRCHIHHHHGEIVCPLLKTIGCYLDINYGFYSSYVVNDKRHDSA